MVKATPFRRRVHAAFATGFFRDVLMAFVLGNGALSDSFLVAFLSELFSCNFRRRHDQSRIPAALCGSQS